MKDNQEKRMPPGDVSNAPSFRNVLAALGRQYADPVAGFFGPASLSWRVNREAVLLLGGMRALFMQVAHPKVAQGVADHSDFRAAPLARALRTFQIVHGMVFGTEREAIEHAVKLRARHAHVSGRLAKSLPAFREPDYRANDPDLLLWVFATLMDSAVVTYELLCAPLSPADKERFYGEGKLFARLVGLDEAALPAAWSDFRRWLSETIDSPLIEVTPCARAIARALLSGTFALRLVGPFNYLIAAGTLDPKLRRGYGLRWNKPLSVLFAVTVTLIRSTRRILPQRLRWLPAARRALRRCQERKAAP